MTLNMVTTTSTPPLTVGTSEESWRVILRSSDYDPGVVDDDNESIVSEDYDDEGDADLDTSIVLRVRQLKAILPGLFTHKNLHQVLSQYFSNELFYANNLVNLTETFLNFEFASFPSTYVLYPVNFDNKDTPNETLNAMVLFKLNNLAHQVNSLVSTVKNFNAEIITAVATLDVKLDLTSLQTAKAKFETIIDKYLGDHLNEAIDTIMNLLYDYNLLMEDNHAYVSYQSDAFLSTIRDHYANIESALHMQAGITKDDICVFKNVIESKFTNNNNYREYIQELLHLIES